MSRSNKLSKRCETARTSRYLIKTKQRRMNHRSKETRRQEKNNMSRRTGTSFSRLGFSPCWKVYSNCHTRRRKTTLTRSLKNGRRKRISTAYITISSILLRTSWVTISSVRSKRSSTSCSKSSRTPMIGLKRYSTSASTSSCSPRTIWMAMASLTMTKM